MYRQVIFILILILCVQLKASKQQHVYKPLTPSQWAQRFQCELNETNATSGQRECQRTRPDDGDYCSKEEDVCWRHHADWMWKYADEMNPEFRVLVREKSMDERLANIIYATVTTRELDIEMHKFKTNDAHLEKELEQLVVGPQVNYTLCGEHLSEMLNQFDEFNKRLNSMRANNQTTPVDDHLNEKQIRLARVLDSNGRYLSGSLSSKPFVLGAYDQCVNSQLLLSSKGPLVGMRVCLASVSLEANLSPELKARQRFEHERSAVVLLVSLCLPESCHSKSLMDHRELIQKWLEIEFKFPASIYLDESANISSLHCIPDKQSPMSLPVSGKLLLGFISIWFTLLVYATYRSSLKCTKDNISLIVQHNKQQTLSSLAETQTVQQSNGSWVNCLSLVENWRDFLEIRGRRVEKEEVKSKHTIHLDVLNPIKVIACFWATTVHAFLADHIGSNNLLRDHKLIESDPNMALVIVSPLVVETYFVISGLLATYLSLKRVDKCQQQWREPTANKLRQYYRDSLELLKKCLALIVARYLRLLPLFYLAFWFKKGLLQYLGSGPMWNYGFNMDAGGQCYNEPWWSPLSLWSVYVPILRKCLPQSYSITTDMIFIIIGAPLIFLIKKWPKFIITLLVSISLWSSWAGLAEFRRTPNGSIVWNLADFKSYGMLQILSTPLSYIYTSPEFRLSSMMFGILVGWLVYNYDRKWRHLGDKQQQQQQHQEKWALQMYWARCIWKPLTLIAFTYPFLISLAATFRLQFKALAYPYHRILCPYYLITSRTFWALSSAIVFLRLLTDWAHRPSVVWMRAKFWRILAKLNYSILLIHLDLLLLDWQIETNLTTMTKYKLLKTFIFVHSVSTFIAILVHILIENPIDKLVKRYVIR